LKSKNGENGKVTAGNNCKAAIVYSCIDFVYSGKGKTA